MAETLAGQHQPAEARAHAAQYLAIVERLAKIDPTNTGWKNDLSDARALVARLQ